MSTDITDQKQELTTFVTPDPQSIVSQSTTKDGEYKSLEMPEKHFSIQKERNFRLLITLMFIIGSLLLFFFTEFQLESAYHIISYGISLTQFCWLISFLTILFSIDHIHFIRIKRKLLPNASLLVIPYTYREYKKYPMRSISNMSALRGSNMFSILNKAMNITFGMVFSAAAIKWSEHNLHPLTIISLILLLLASHGGGIVALWELEDSYLSVCLHQTGALLGFVAGPLAFVLYQRFSLLSSLLLAFTWLFVAVFVCLQHCIKKPKHIHGYSLLCILVELIAYLNGMATVVLFVYCMDGDQILGVH